MMLFLQMTSLLVLAMAPQQEPLGEYWGTAEKEALYYKMVDVPLPEELAVEAGSFEVMPNRSQLAIATRRGDIFLVDGAFDEHPEPRFHKFASGLDEVFGMGWRGDSMLVTQQTEVTRITDIDKDGRADQFKTLSDVWGFRHYHEFAFGSKPDSEGNIWVALCLSKSYHSDAPFRGWCLKITPEGETIPVCSGIRSPCGIGPNEHGVMFYAESQGPWNGSCSLKVLEPGGFMGHPISFNWYELAPGLGEAPVTPNSPSRLEVERKRVKELVPYAVVFPYKRMGRSISGFMVDKTGGKFGPFENQIFIGDFSLGVVMRATTEKVNGVWQGACYPFREGFDTGLLAVQFTPEGSLIAGGTNRGWPVRGPKAYAVQRLDWTGRIPFEIKEINARPDGFAIKFTKPLDRESAVDVSNYELKTFTHIYQQGYGSPEVDQTVPTVSKAVVGSDGMSVEINVDGLVQGHVHDIFLPGLRSAVGESLLHTSAYYTLNEIPKRTSRLKKIPLDDSASEGLTRDVVNFEKPADAEQLVGQSNSKLIPESDVKCQWTFADGVLTASPKWDSVVTPESYRDFRMHIEFNINDASDEPRERNGNSGIYIQQRYELQILNSYGVSIEDYKFDDCSSIYGFKKPDKIVNQPAGQWQSFDIVFRAARFKGKQKVANARLTVYQNEELIHDDVVLKRKTGAGKPEGPLPGPIKFQGHHNEVKFRNVWIQPLDLQPNQAMPMNDLQTAETNQENESQGDLWLTIPGKDGPGKGKHVVLIAADQEYRSEQSMPMLAKILAERHGFDCTVLFSMNEDDEVDPTLPAPFKDKQRRHRIPGLEKLDEADCVVWLSRFMQLSDDQMDYFHRYFDSGKPIVALRTANHGFWGGKRYQKEGKDVSLRELLGGTFMGHHGGWHRESTRGVIEVSQTSHPVLAGVSDIWGPSDVYRCHDDRHPFPKDCELLVRGQPLVNLQPDSADNEDKEPLPIAWAKHWIGNQGLSTRVFHFTMGSANDFANKGVRRMTINAVYWGLKLESKIRPNSSVDIVGEYSPLKSGFQYEKLGVQPRPIEHYK